MSRDGIYTKAEELKNSVDEKTEELKALSNEAPTLKFEIAQIKFYFENVQNRRRLDSMGQVRLAAAKEVVDKHGIRSVSEIAELEERLKITSNLYSDSPEQAHRGTGKAEKGQSSCERL